MIVINILLIIILLTIIAIALNPHFHIFPDSFDIYYALNQKKNEKYRKEDDYMPDNSKDIKTVEKPSNEGFNPSSQIKLKTDEGISQNKQFGQNNDPLKNLSDNIPPISGGTRPMG